MIDSPFSVDFGRLIALNGERFNRASIHPQYLRELDHVAARLAAPKAKERYVRVMAAAGRVPWPAIAVIHEREASQAWSANLAQGDPWNRRSRHVPAGEGPFPSWEAAAVHALTTDDHLSAWRDWSGGGTATALEKFNGLGYYDRGRPSPYPWARTDQYVDGKFTSDDHFDPTYVDHQNGCVALLARMSLIDSTIATDFGWRFPPGCLTPAATPDLAHDNAWLQDALNKLGAAPALAVDGVFGPATKRALRAEQRKLGLLDDGTFGPGTDRAISAALAAAKGQTQ